MNKIGIIVPYRDRENHLKEFLPAIQKTLTEQHIEFEIIIVEQLDGLSFNRGKLLNIGVEKAIELGCNYVALHDVDMLPIKADYSIVDRPTHIATKFTSDTDEKKIVFDTYFGGVTLFPISDYIKVNGYSNKYFGWGFEDDDLLYRCEKNLKQLNVKHLSNIPTNFVGFEFNGWDSVITIPKPFKLKNYTMLVSFEPYQIKCTPLVDVDDFSIVAIPGYDTGFSYDSFKRYKFETWTTNKRVITLKSDIMETKKTILAVTVNIDDKIIKLYQDGELIDETTYEGRLLNYRSAENIIMGLTGSPQNQRAAFNGVVDYFALWNHSLEEGQVKSITENIRMGLTEQFDGYLTPHCLEICYDMKSSTNLKVFDLSGNDRDGTVHFCNRVEIPQNKRTYEKVIPWRRKGLFKLLPHQNNGYVDNHWKNKKTRINQIRFYNQILTEIEDITNDGLNNIGYKKISERKIDKVHYLSVKL